MFLEEKKIGEAGEVSISAAKKLLYDACDLMERRGHVKGQYITSEGGVCIKGAIFCLIAGKPHATYRQFFDGNFSQAETRVGEDTRYREIQDACAEVLGYSEPAVYNNDELRSPEEVLAGFRRVADRMK